MGLIYCILAFVATLTQTRRSLGRGLATVMWVGYFYGIVRANYLDSFTHFLFDAAVMGMYAGHFLRRPSAGEQQASTDAVFWTRLLALMPILLFMAPLQDPFVQLVGLRSTVFFLPMLIIGTRLEGEDLKRLTFTLACLNLVALGFAIAEYSLGLHPFFPRNAVTGTIYRSNDILIRDGLELKRAFRIPACFSSAHSYGGTVVATVPLLVDFLQRREHNNFRRAIVLASCIAAVIGAFLCGARSPVVVVIGLGLVILMLNLRWQVRLGLVAVGIIVFTVVQSDERLQRFKSLSNAEAVEGRVRGSVNAQFGDIIAEYPMGAGLARAVGTSIPFFLQDIALPQIGIENEYGRIAVELGLPGLAIWVCFLINSLFFRRARKWSSVTPVGGLLMRVYLMVMWIVGLIGTGMLTSIPQTSLLLLQLGILMRAEPPSRRPVAARGSSFAPKASPAP